MAAHAKELGPRVLLAADRREPLGSPLDDDGDAGQGFDVVDDRRAAVEPHHCREGRLDAGIAALALDALEQGRLLAADVGARAAVDDDFHVEALAQDIAPAWPAVRASAMAASRIFASAANSPRM